MPYEMEKVSEKCWRVYNKETGEEHAKCTTKSKAEAQLRLLRGVEKGTFKPTGGAGKPTIKTTPLAQGWREYYSSQVKGKKFKSRAEVNAFMKEVAQKYRSTK